VFCALQNDKKMVNSHADNKILLFIRLPAYLNQSVLCLPIYRSNIRIIPRFKRTASVDRENRRFCGDYKKITRLICKFVIAKKPLSFILQSHL